MFIFFIPNRTFLVRLGGISGEFGRARVHILAGRSRARLNSPDMPWKYDNVFTVPKFSIKSGHTFIKSVKRH